MLQYRINARYVRIDMRRRAQVGICAINLDGKKIKFRIKMQIKLNGKAYETAASDLEGLKREVKFSGEIAVINGYASTQNCELSSFCSRAVRSWRRRSFAR